MFDHWRSREARNGHCNYDPHDIRIVPVVSELPWPECRLKLTVGRNDSTELRAGKPLSDIPTAAVVQLPAARVRRHLQLALDAVEQVWPSVGHVLVLHTDLGGTERAQLYYSHTLHFGAIRRLFEARLPDRSVRHLELDIRPLLDLDIQGRRFRDILLDMQRQLPDWMSVLSLPERLRYWVMLEHAMANSSGTSVAPIARLTQPRLHTRLHDGLLAAILILNAVLYHHGPEHVPAILDDMRLRGSDAWSALGLTDRHVIYPFGLHGVLHPVMHRDPIYNLGVFLWSSVLWQPPFSRVFLDTLRSKRFVHLHRATQAVLALGDSAS